MTAFRLPPDLTYNRGLIQDPVAFAREAGSASWLYLVGDEFAAMPGGISWEQVQRALPVTARVISDPPRTMTLDLAREQVAALDDLPRPTLISCRTGPRASAVAYLYAGLQGDASPEEVLAAAVAENAPFCASEELRDWVSGSLQALRAERPQKE